MWLTQITACQHTHIQIHDKMDTLLWLNHNDYESEKSSRKGIENVVIFLRVLLTFTSTSMFQLVHAGRLELRRAGVETNIQGEPLNAAILLVSIFLSLKARHRAPYMITLLTFLRHCSYNQCF